MPFRIRPHTKKPDKKQSSPFGHIFALLAGIVFCFYAILPQTFAEELTQQRSQQSRTNSLTLPAQNASLGSHEYGAAQTIRNQLDAIRARDEDTAYNFLTEKAHEKFETAAQYLSALRLDFRPLYNATKTDTAFIDHFERGNTSIQKIEVTDRYTKERFTAIYKLVRQPDGRWLIDSFSLLHIDDDAEPI